MVAVSPPARALHLGRGSGLPGVLCASLRPQDRTRAAGFALGTARARRVGGDSRLCRGRRGGGMIAEQPLSAVPAVLLSRSGGALGLQIPFSVGRSSRGWFAADLGVAEGF